MARKAEITVRVCIKLPGKVQASTMERYAEWLHRQCLSLLRGKSATIVHSSHHVRTWSDDS